MSGSGIGTYILLIIAVAAGWLLGRVRKPASASKDRKSQDIFEDYFVGLNYLLNDEPDEAIDTFIRALELNNDTVETHLALGTLLRRRGKVDKAIKVHQALLARSGLEKKFSHMISLELATDYISAGLLDRAERLLKNLLVEKGAVTQPALHGLITIYQLEKEWSKSVECCQSLLLLPGVKNDSEIRSSAAHFCCELADQALQGGQLAEAKKQVKAAFTFDRRSVRASFLLASIEQKAGNFSAAIKELIRVQSHRPEFLVEVLAPLADCYRLSGNIDAYEKFLVSALKNKAEPNAVVQLTRLKQAKVGDEEAIRFLDSQLQDRPSIQGLLAMIELEASQAEKRTGDNLRNLHKLVENYLRSKSSYLCNECGFQSKRLYWQCPSCKKWDKTTPGEILIDAEIRT